ncbi:DUF397 domain-containing protein [Streptomyces sp. KLOTTS4A1]
MRDSKFPDGSVLFFQVADWTSFLTALKDGRLGA